MRYYSYKKRIDILKLQYSIILAFLIIAIIGIIVNTDMLYSDIVYNKISTVNSVTKPIIIKKTSLPQVTEYEQIKNESIEEKVKRIAKEEDFKYTDYLLRLIYCESRFNPKAINDNGYYGKDRGLLQINDFYHPEVSDECAFDIECSIKWAMLHINNGYQREWACDKIIKGNYNYPNKILAELD